MLSGCVQDVECSLNVDSHVLRRILQGRHEWGRCQMYDYFASLNTLEYVVSIQNIDLEEFYSSTERVLNGVGGGYIVLLGESSD